MRQRHLQGLGKAAVPPCKPSPTHTLPARPRLPRRSFTALDALKGWLEDKSGEGREEDFAVSSACPACLAPAARRPRPSQPGTPAASPAAASAEPVQVGESEEWMRSRRQDVQTHAAQTLDYDW